LGKLNSRETGKLREKFRQSCDQGFKKKSKKRKEKKKKNGPNIQSDNGRVREGKGTWGSLSPREPERSKRKTGVTEAKKTSKVDVNKTGGGTKKYQYFLGKITRRPGRLRGEGRTRLRGIQIPREGTEEPGTF